VRRGVRPVCASALKRAEPAPSELIRRSAKVLHEASPQRIKVALGASVRPRRSTALRSAKPTGLDNLIDPTAPHPNTIPRRVAMKMEDNAFNDLPLLLAVPRAAQLLGISRAAAYRLAASGDLPVRRLGGRVYVVTAGLRELAS
jgi:Helix-turn-helix domain